MRPFIIARQKYFFYDKEERNIKSFHFIIVIYKNERQCNPI